MSFYSNAIDKPRTNLSVTHLLILEIKKALTKRRNELDERGFQKEHKMIPDFLVKLSPVSDVRIIPPALAHQLLLKKSSSNDSNFARALNEDK